jgi:hypothetical protein
MVHLSTSLVVVAIFGGRTLNCIDFGVGNWQYGCRFFTDHPVWRRKKIFILLSVVPLSLSVTAKI